MKNNDKGMTLIEVMVSIAILGILAVAFLPMFSTGIRFLVMNGKKIEEMYENQEAIEQKVAQGAAVDTTKMTIVFPGKTIEVNGENIADGSFNLFIPKK